MDWWTNTLKWVNHYTLLKCYTCLRREGKKIKITAINTLPELRRTPSEVRPNGSFLCSSPVWLHHHLCSGVPAGSPPGTAQQHHRDSSWRLQVCHSVEETHACPSHRHRSVWSLSAPAPPCCLSCSVCFIFRPELLFPMLKCKMESKHFPSYGDRYVPIPSVTALPYAAPPFSPAHLRIWLQTPPSNCLIIYDRMLLVACCPVIKGRIHTEIFRKL